MNYLPHIAAFDEVEWKNMRNRWKWIERYNEEIWTIYYWNESIYIYIYKKRTDIDATFYRKMEWKFDVQRLKFYQIE